MSGTLAQRVPAVLLRAALALVAAGATGCDSGADQTGDGRASWVRAGAEPDVPDEARYGGTLVVAGRNDPQSMNALVSNDFESGQHQIHVLFVTLVRGDREHVARPYLARTWEYSDDSTQVVFQLRDDLRWHDGVRVSARDVAFTFERVKDPRVPFVNQSYFDLWEAVEVVDEHTVRFHLRPHAHLLYGWTRTAIMPEHLLGAVAPGELAVHPFGAVAPVGSGPFRFVERVPGDRWVFEANEDFPDELGGRPYLDRLVYRQIPDETTLASSLQTGEADVVIDASPAMLGRFDADTTVAVATYHAPDYNFIAWNSRRPLFADPMVRRALTLAMDRDVLVRALRGGHGTVASGPVGPWHWAYDTAWRALPYDPDSARVLLEAAGWSDTDGDGVRDRHGIPFRFELLSTPRSEWRDVAAIVQANLAEVGVQVRPTVRDQAALIPRVTGPDRRFDAVLLGWARDVQLDDRDLWACDQLGQPFQFAGYCNPELDLVLDRMRLTPERGRLRALIRQYHEMLAADQPYTFLYYVDKIDLHRRWVGGLEMDSRGDWAGVSRWWILPERRAAAGAR